MTTLATKADLFELKAELKLDLEKIRSEMQLLKWMIGFLLAGVATLILKAFF